MFKLIILVIIFCSVNAGIISSNYGLGLGIGHGVAVASPVATIASPAVTIAHPVAAVAAPVAVASHGAVSYQNYNQISVNPTPVIAKVAAPVITKVAVTAPIATPLISKIATVNVAAPVGIAAPVGYGSYGLGGYEGGYHGLGVASVGKIGGYNNVIYH